MEMAAAQTWLPQLKWQGWDHESYPEAKDLIMIPTFSIFFFILRFVLDSYVFEKCGTRLILGRPEYQKGISETEKDSLRKTVVKFKESSWKMCYFLAAEIFALSITYSEPYFTNTRYFWVGPGSQLWPDQKAKLNLKALYAFAGGFYAYSIFALVFWETRRKDFGVSMSHHAASLILIVFSYVARFPRVGAVVMAIHDGSDVYLEVAKLGKYSGSEIIPSIFFVLFAVSWLLLRLLVYPFWVLRSTSYEVLTLLDRNYNKGPILYYLFNGLLMTLFVIHIYWWVLIWRMIVKQIQAMGKVSDDVRSDSESDDEDEKVD